MKVVYVLNSFKYSFSSSKRSDKITVKAPDQQAALVRVAVPFKSKYY